MTHTTAVLFREVAFFYNSRPHTIARARRKRLCCLARKDPVVPRLCPRLLARKGQVPTRMFKKRDRFCVSKARQIHLTRPLITQLHIKRVGHFDFSKGQRKANGQIW